MKSSPDISAVVPVENRFEETGTLALEYVAALEATGKAFELIFVLDGDHPDIKQKLLSLAGDDDRIRIIQLAKEFGEAAALSAGFSSARAATIMTLPAYYQVEADEIPALIESASDVDMVIGKRWPRASKSAFERFRRGVFHWMVRAVTGDSFDDLGCGVRVIKRDVIEEVPIYGDQHRFFPLLAIRNGFRVIEVEVKQSAKDRRDDGYGLRTYIRRLLDLMTVVFLVRFTKKPLRFFGMIGGTTLFLGGVFLAYVIVERLFFGVALADRPALLLSSLLVVLGLQILALGLLGELIIFTHAQNIKEYKIEKIVN